jgi:peroxiredoxin
MNAGFRLVLSLLLLNGHSLATAADPPNGVDPFWVLLHEPAVVRELKLSSEQRRSYQALLDDLDLKPILTATQRRRLREIHYRRLGIDALLRDDVADELGLTASQRQRIEELLSDARQSLAAIEQQVREGKPREPLEKRHADLQAASQKKILAVMKPEQQANFKALLGEAFDAAQLGRPEYKAPELVNTGQWINSGPLTLADQRGKVVILHFYACGCINCIHNYPSYRDWQERFRGQDVVMIGIQTPETESERQFDHVQRKAAEEKLTFPILFDARSENWNAWGNSMWPTVYVIDRRGYLRYFWPGELKWQGNDGETFLRERIDALLQERGS